MTNPAITAAFAANPRATLAVTEIGHAYGTAKFGGRCKLTGTEIHRGQPVRNIKGVTRAGLEFSVWTAALGLLERVWRSEVSYDDASGARRTAHLFAWKRCGDGWQEQVAAVMADAAPGTTVVVVEPSACHGAALETKWHLGTDGKWGRLGTYRSSSAKQLLGSLRRSKKYTMWTVVPASS